MTLVFGLVDDLLDPGHHAPQSLADNLDRIMDGATAAAVALADRQRVDLRSAATMLAVKRVADATALRGLYP